MKLLTFYRIKKKSLILSYSICPEELTEILKMIKNKKLFQCILKSDPAKIYEEETFTGHS